jgi:hypothetical protein
MPTPDLGAASVDAGKKHAIRLADSSTCTNEDVDVPCFLLLQDTKRSYLMLRLDTANWMPAHARIRKATSDPGTR